MSCVKFLQEFYKRCCGKENFSGIEISAEDSKGWFVYIDLFDTDYETKEFKDVYIYKNKDNWIKCSKESHMFKGCGGSENLEDILTVFKGWAQNL